MAPEPGLSTDDVLAIEYPGPPAWSADGRFVATAVYEDDGKSLHVAAVEATDGAVRTGEPWRYSPDEAHVTGFEWAPEERAAELVVTTDGDELNRIDATDHSIERLAKVPAGDAEVTWSPGGDRIAFYRDGTPWIRDLERGDEQAFDVPERGPYLADERMLEWGPDGDRLAYRFVEDRTKHVGVVDIEREELVWRTQGPFSTTAPVWLADGRLVVDRRGDRGRVRTVEVVDLDTADRTTLVREEDRERGAVSRGAATVSPNGTHLAIALPADGWEHVHLLDPHDGATTQLTAGEFEDKGVADASPQWVDDNTLVFASNRRDAGERQLFAVDVADGTVTPVVGSRGTNVHPRPSPDGSLLAFVHADRDVSPELRIRPFGSSRDESGDDSARVTRSAIEDWPAEPIAPEHVTLESTEGATIHGYLLDPRDSDAVDDDATGLPGVVWAHGGPMRQMRDGFHPSRSYGLAYSFHQYLATRGYVGLFVNYRGGIGYGREFRTALATMRGEREIADVVAAGEYLQALPYVDPDAIATWGLSYGGYTTLQVLGAHPEAFDLGINLAGLADLEAYREWAEETKYSPAESFQTVQLGGYPHEAPEMWAEASPETHMDAYEAPLYNFHGTADRYVNFGQLDVVVDRLLALDKEFEAEYYPDETHVFSRRATWERTFQKVEEAFDSHLRW